MSDLQTSFGDLNGLKGVPLKANEPFEIQLRYLDEGETSAILHPSIGGGDMAKDQGNFVIQTVLIQNARGENTSIDREGFELKTHSSKVKNFYDEDIIASTYTTEVRELVRETTGARRVEIFLKCTIHLLMDAHNLPFTRLSMTRMQATALPIAKASKPAASCFLEE